MEKSLRVACLEFIEGKLDWEGFSRWFASFERRVEDGEDTVDTEDRWLFDRLQMATDLVDEGHQGWHELRDWLAASLRPKVQSPPAEKRCWDDPTPPVPCAGPCHFLDTGTWETCAFGKLYPAVNIPKAGVEHVVVPDAEVWVIAGEAFRAEYVLRVVKRANELGLEGKRVMKLVRTREASRAEDVFTLEWEKQ